jgi:hypothetical protein
MYPNLQLAFDRAKERAGYAGTVDPLRDAYATELLTISAGKINGVTEYRPLYVAAKLLEQDLDVQALDEADKAKFTRQETTIASLLSQQMAIDLALGTIVPLGFEAVVSVDGVTELTPRMSIFTA